MTTNLNLITVPTTREELADRLESEGYVIGKPAYVHPDAITIDREVATGSACDQCGAFGLEFLPWRPRDRRERSYRCMAFCSCCDDAFEF